MSVVGVPIKILHEGEGHVVTIENKLGETFRGTLVEAEDSMNCELENVTFTARDGQKSQMERCYIRGSQVRCFLCDLSHFCFCFLILTLPSFSFKQISLIDLFFFFRFAL